MEDEGTYDTAPDSTQDFQPIYQLPGQKLGGPTPSDTLAAPESGILLPVSPAAGDTLGAAAADTLRPATTAPGATPGGTATKPAAAAPKQKSGVLGMSPAMLLAGLLVLHVFVVRTVTD